eukprot:CCRYP_004114-RA/>CCRYP_004114-RA protein AED:0.45 eAED:0.45 QI:0/0/0/1/0/0/2/0/136
MALRNSTPNYRPHHLHSTNPRNVSSNKSVVNFCFLGKRSTPHFFAPKQTCQLLDYLASQEEAVLTYNASEMILGVHSNASYLSEPNTHSRADGHFFLSNNAVVPPNNGAILNIAHIIKHVMASATEAELGALYITA